MNENYNTNIAPNIENSIIKYDNFIYDINKSLDLAGKNSSKTHLNGQKSSPIWWDEECTKICSRRKLKFKAYIDNMSMENYIEYKKTDAQTKLLLKYKKRTSWKKFCSTLNKDTP